MSRTATPAPITDAAYWRKILARLHPDSGESEDLFVFAQGVRETIEALPSANLCPCRRDGDGGGTGGGEGYANRIDGEPAPERVPYPSYLGEPMRFIDLTYRAIPMSEAHASHIICRLKEDASG